MRGGSARLSIDIPRIIELFREGKINLDNLISGHYPLEQVNTAIDLMVRGKALRNVIMFD